jgi:hypothetical protein
VPIPGCTPLSSAGSGSSAYTVGLFSSRGWRRAAETVAGSGIDQEVLVALSRFDASRMGSLPIPGGSNRLRAAAIYLSDAPAELFEGVTAIVQGASSAEFTFQLEPAQQRWSIVRRGRKVAVSIRNISDFEDFAGQAALRRRVDRRGRLRRHQDAPDVQISPSGSRRTDFARANEAVGLPQTPDGYTWHHHQVPGRMQQIETRVHMMTGHTGGFIGEVG